MAVDSVGRSGGLVCLWDPKIFQKTDVILDRRFIWIVGKIKGVDEAINMVNIYGPHDPAMKKTLWQKLLDLRSVHAGLWILLGDFNTVRFASDRFNSKFCKYSARDFNQFIDDGNLMEYGMGGRKFTYWSANGDNLSKIDRMLVCKDFHRLWPAACLAALPREASDHCPVILKLQVKDFDPIPFKLFSSWLTKKGADEIIKEALAKPIPPGPPDRRIQLKFKEVKKSLKDWVKASKQHEEMEAVNLRSTIPIIELAAEDRVLTDVEKQVRMDSYCRLKELDYQNYVGLKQKSRMKWAIDGEENSKFFHGMMKNNMADKRINGLSVDGVWCTDPATIKNEFQGHFKNRFCEKDSARPRLVTNSFKKLTVEQGEMLIRPFSLEEIKEGVWGCGSDKAPGPDGINFEFI